MKLAILGADDDAIELVKWAVQHGGHELAAAYDSHTYALRLAEFAPNIRLNNNWEELFLATVADAVVIGRGGKEAALEAHTDPAERRADQLRKLTQAAVPMIIVCPACEAIVGFEIEMIRGDVGALIMPYVPGASNPAIVRVHTLAAQDERSEIGKLQQVVFEREQSDRSRDAVLLRLSRDITLLRGVIGYVQTVSASGPTFDIGRDPLGPKPTQLPDLANLSVVLGGSEALTARWSIAPATGSDQGRLTLIGQCGRAIATISNEADCSYELVERKRSTATFPADERIGTVFEHLQTELERGNPKTFDLWHSFCRDQEAAEAVDRSLIRGRTIELFNEAHTEEQSFKGVMAAGGCLLLLAALAIVFVIVLVESLQLPIRSLLIWRLWPLYLLIPIVIFLLLQLLQLAVKREPGLK